MAFGQVGQAIGARVGEKVKDPMEEYMKNLHQALEKYHADKGAYPAPAILDKDGRPLFSWRVALLPYMGDEGKELYSQFRLDEPWDSLYNKRLLKKLPKALQPPNHAGWGLGRYKTETQLVTGTGTAFADSKGPRKADLDLKAVLLVNAPRRTVYWTKPADIVYTPDQPLPAIFAPKQAKEQFFRTFGPEGLPMLLGDGTYRMMRLEEDEKEIRAMIQRPKK
jgi:hypothetical protein